MKKVFNGKTIDAFYRGISRGMTANTLVNFLGKLFNFNAQPAAAITSIPTFMITTYTSYAGTRWWTNSYEEINTLVSQSQPQTRAQTCRNVTDALFRGASRAEAISNCVMLIGTFAGCELTIPAGVLAVIALGLTSWSSYQRSDKRRRYAASSLPLFFNHAEHNDDSQVGSEPTDVQTRNEPYQVIT